MNLHTILIVGLAFAVAGCAEEEQVASAPAEEAAPSEAAAPWETDDSWRNVGFMQHMHEHAEYLDELNFALADGDLEAAMVPANWLASHETYADVQPEWMPYLYEMRSEAEAVEAASDLGTARAAAARINAKCQGCHNAVDMGAE